jgi:hypothetical protein
VARSTAVRQSLPDAHKEVPNECRNAFPCKIGAFRAMRATPRREHFPVEVQKSSELQALHRRNVCISTMRAPVPKEAWLAVERGPYLLGFRAMGRGWTKHQRHETRPRANSKNRSFAGTYGANRDRTGDLLLAKQEHSKLKIARFPCKLAISGGRAYMRKPAGLGSIRLGLGPRAAPWA